jgi:outer membrane protein OmpA-like peptidoglycan-associated protein
MTSRVIGKCKRLAFAAVLVAAAAAPAGAQQAGSLELNGFGTWTKFDNSLNFEDKFGAGGLLGIFFAKNVALEGDASYTKTHFDTGVPGDFGYLPIRARLAAHVPLGSSYSSLILGAGYVAALYRNDLQETDHGATGLVGFKLGLTRHLALRADGIVDYLPSPFNEGPTVESNVHYTARAGLSILIGSRRSDRHDIRADSSEDTEQGRADTIQQVEQARIDSIRSAERLRADSAQRVAEAQVDSIRQAAVQDSLRIAKRVRQDSLRLAQQVAQADSLRRAERARADSIQRVEQARVDSIRRAGVEDSMRVAERAREDSLRLAQRTGQVDSLQMQLMLERKKNLVLLGVTFESNQSRLTTDAAKVLDFVAQSLQAHPETKIEVGGYTDATGSAAYNQRLSLARARAVRAYLIRQGVVAEQLTAVGHGTADPIASNDTAEDRAQNRRVELKRID